MTTSPIHAHTFENQQCTTCGLPEREYHAGVQDKHLAVLQQRAAELERQVNWLTGVIIGAIAGGVVTAIAQMFWPL